MKIRQEMIYSKEYELCDIEESNLYEDVNFILNCHASVTYLSRACKIDKSLHKIADPYKSRDSQQPSFNRKMVIFQIAAFISSSSDIFSIW